ncbi:MAG: hypothetical protein GXO26_07995 [Crenarchaeota archaeon]|nr:hypothetical protein [Thermoproteota archaeon]
MRYRRRSIPYRLEEEVASALSKLGYHTFLLDAHPSPDIIAMRPERLLLVEVKYGSHIEKRQEETLLTLSKCFRELYRINAVPCIASYNDGTVVLRSLLDGSTIHVFEILI